MSRKKMKKKKKKMMMKRKKIEKSLDYTVSQHRRSHHR